MRAYVDDLACFVEVSQVQVVSHCRRLSTKSMSCTLGRAMKHDTHHCEVLDRRIHSRGPSVGEDVVIGVCQARVLDEVLEVAV